MVRAWFAVHTSDSADEGCLRTSAALEDGPGPLPWQGRVAEV